MLHEKTLLKFHWFRGATQQRSYFTFKRIQWEPTIYMHVFMGTTILIWKINFKFFLLRCLTHCTRYYFENHQNNNWSKFQAPKIGFCAPFWFKMAHGRFASHHKTIGNKWQNLTRYLCMAVYSTRRDGQKFCGSNYTETATFLYVYSSI